MSFVWSHFWGIADRLCRETVEELFWLTSEEGGWSEEEWQERGDGGSMALVNSRGETVHLVALGDPTKAWATQTAELAAEKAARAIQAHQTKGEHIISSWQTRNPEERQYGGGIVVQIGDEHYGLAFSGLPEAVDHFMMVRLALIRQHGLMLVEPPEKYLVLPRTATQAQMRACGIHIDIANPALAAPSYEVAVA